MNLAELRDREDIDAIVCRTLEHNLGEFCGVEVGKVLPAAEGAPGQLWKARTMLSGYCTDELCVAGRTFLADQFRYTPVRWRAPAQWLVGTALASRVGLLVVGEHGFTVEIPIPRSGRYLIIPGNRRVRLFDFHRGITRTVAKAGFDADAIRAEVSVRDLNIPGPFTLIQAVDEDERWFEERILRGYPLPRCPPWQRRARWEVRAMERLAEWLDATSDEVRFDEYLHDLTTRIGARLHALEDSHPLSTTTFEQTLERASRATAGGRLELARSHGDFQPGNIFIDTVAGEPVLIDWEFSTPRQKAYDGLVYELQSRFPEGLTARVVEYVTTGRVDRAGGTLPRGGTLQDRGDRIALFLLEELDWYLHPALPDQHTELPASFGVFCRELPAVIACI